MGATGSFTDRVRGELARLPIDDERTAGAELAALLRVAGSLHLTGGDGRTELSIEVTTTSGAVARRVFQLLVARDEPRPELAVRAPGGVRRRSTYVVLVGREAAPAVALDLGLFDEDGRPTRTVDDVLLRADELATAYVRGALLGAGSVSTPGRPPHLEVVTHHLETAEQLARTLGRLVETPVATAATSAGGARVVVKSGEVIGAVLASLGATGSFLEWEEQRLRRQLRGDAQRLANADAANVQRAIDAAAAQTAAVERAIDVVGWEGLDDELRQVALARLANPSASLGELGELCDPPLGKSAVFRRLQRLAQLAEHG
ncbi:MAG: DNA-binding protein WhiA [Actinomycetes bacterium]